MAYAQHDHWRQVRAGRPDKDPVGTLAEALDAFYRWASRYPACDPARWDRISTWFTEAYLAARAHPAAGSGRLDAGLK